MRPSVGGGGLKSHEARRHGKVTSQITVCSSEVGPLNQIKGIREFQ